MRETHIMHRSREVRGRVLGKLVHFRAVIEFSNFCHHNCGYCGMRIQNSALARYRLEEEVVATCAKRAVQDGIRIIMLQAGDDLKYDVRAIERVVRYARTNFGATVLLCIGDRPLRDYEILLEAGATQAIVKFETTNRRVYQRLRPHSSVEQRLGLIWKLNSMGLQVSSGFIQGLPGTAMSDTERDIETVLSLPLFAASVSPFIPSDETPLKGAPCPKLEDVLESMAKLRVEKPSLLIPSVSALNLLSSREGSAVSGQLLGLRAGANVLTINYTPRASRELYVIYKKERWVVEINYAKDIVREAGLVPSLQLIEGDSSGAGSIQ